MSKAGYGAKVEVESKECKIWRIWAILVKFFFKLILVKLIVRQNMLLLVMTHDSLG